jgi:hypothetical protein
LTRHAFKVFELKFNEQTLSLIINGSSNTKRILSIEHIEPIHFNLLTTNLNIRTVSGQENIADKT